MMAGQLFAQALPALTEFTSPRAWAFGLIGIHEYLRRLSGDSLVNQTREALTSRLDGTLRQQYAGRTGAGLKTSFPTITPSSPHALILSGRATGQKASLNEACRPYAG